MRKKLNSTWLLLLAFGLGLVLLAYPRLSNWWNSVHQTQAILSYAQTVSGMGNSEYDRIISEALDYNSALAEAGIHWLLTDEEKENYESQLNFEQNGNMGYINIPKIDVTLPIYHGTSERVLQTSVGHIEGSSLPVGGETCHCVLSGHRGLPRARLFSDLDKMAEGDIFMLNILNETLTYEVDQIRVVTPTDLEALALQEGRDYCTLVTCTPYGVNTHRLLVRGHRIANISGEAKVTAEALQIRPAYIAPFLAVPLFLLFSLAAILTAGGKDHREELMERWTGRTH